MHRSRGQSAGPRDADEMCVSRVGWKRPDRLWKTRPNQPRKVHIRGSEKDELWDRPCARMGMSSVPEWACRDRKWERTLWFLCALRERGLTDSVKIGLNGIVTLLCQGYCGSEFRAASLSWVGISHTPDPKGTLGMPEEMTSSAKGAEGCPGGARGIDLIKSARVESRCRRGRRSSRGKFPERFRGRRGRPRCRGLG